MANTEKNETYVTELTDPDDRWLSVTDAARITRRQEKSIRDWIESGKLPVNPERTGLNKRTRLVRLSDLQVLTPIVDPEAGITTDLGLLDLPNIPKAQQRLAEQMTALQQSFGTLASQQEEFAKETRLVWGVHQDQYRALDQRDGELLTFIQQAREHWIANLQEASRALREELAARITGQAQELQQARTELAELVVQSDQALRLWVTEQIGQSEARLRQDVTALSTRLSEAEQALRKELANAVQKLQSTVADLDSRQDAGLQELDMRIAATLQARQTAHDQLQAQSDERYSEARRRLTQLQGTVTEQNAATSRQLTQLAGSSETVSERLTGQETRISQVEAAWRQRAEAAEKDVRQLRLDVDGQVKNQQALQRQLDEERRAREALAKQVEKLLQQGKKDRT